MQSNSESAPPFKKFKQTRCRTKAAMNSLHPGLALPAYSSMNSSQDSALNGMSYLEDNGYDLNEWEANYHEELVESMNEVDVSLSDMEEVYEVHGEEEDENEKTDEIQTMEEMNFEEIGKLGSINLILATHHRQNLTISLPAFLS